MNNYYVKNGHKCWIPDNMTFLDISSENVTELVVNENKNITKIYAIDCNLKSVSINCSNLRKFYCGLNENLKLLKIDAPKLKILECWTCDLSDLQLINCPHLKELHCEENRIKELIINWNELNHLECDLELFPYMNDYLDEYYLKIDRKGIEKIKKIQKLQSLYN